MLCQGFQEAAGIANAPPEEGQAEPALCEGAHHAPGLPRYFSVALSRFTYLHSFWPLTVCKYGQSDCLKARGCILAQ